MKKNELIFNYFLINITTVLLLLFYIFMMVTFINPLELEQEWHILFIFPCYVFLISYSFQCIEDAILCWKSYSKEIKEYIKDNR